MEGYLDDFNPKNSITPAGIFTNRIEVSFISFDLALPGKESS